MWHTILSWEQLCRLEQYEFLLEEEGGIEGFLVVCDQQPHAYLNSCPHQQLNLNWSPHQFLDSEHRFLLCNTHGALFEPASGLCVSGPCLGEMLEALPVRIKDDQVQVQILPERV